MTLGHLKLFSLALAATTLAGCASLSTSAIDRRDNAHSYAWNVWQSMAGAYHASEMQADPDWTALETELQAPNNSWHLAKTRTLLLNASS